MSVDLLRLLQRGHTEIDKSRRVTPIFGCDGSRQQHDTQERQLERGHPPLVRATLAIVVLTRRLTTLVDAVVQVADLTLQRLLATVELGDGVVGRSSESVSVHPHHWHETHYHYHWK